MGCGYPPRTVENDLKIFSEEKKQLNPNEVKKKIDISFILYQKLEKFIQLNPFYNISISEFEETLNSIKNQVQKENDNNKDIIIDSITKIYFNDKITFIKPLFIKVIDYSLENYNFGIKYENNSDIIFIIITFIFILLTDNKQGKKYLFRKNIFEILRNIKENKGEYKYNRKQLFNFIIKIVQIHTNFFKYFLLYFAFCEIFVNENAVYNKIIKEDSTINKINSFIEYNLGKINENLSVEFLNFLFISEINNKLKSYLEEVDNEDDISILFNDDKIIKVINAIYEIINNNNFISFLLFGENKNY